MLAALTGVKYQWTAFKIVLLLDNRYCEPIQNFCVNAEAFSFKSLNSFYTGILIL
jgi:hypothetical protein